MNQVSYVCFFAGFINPIIVLSFFSLSFIFVVVCGIFEWNSLSFIFVVECGIFEWKRICASFIFIVYLLYVLPLAIQLSRGNGSHFNPTTFLCLSQARTWISNIICCVCFLCLVIGDCLFCWYWWNCWPSLHNSFFFFFFFYFRNVYLPSIIMLENILGKFVSQENDYRKDSTTLVLN